MPVKDLALAALLGPGLVVGVATTLDGAGVLDVEGLLRRVVAVVAVVLALGVLVLLGGLRRAQAARSRPRRRAPAA
ncbi:hypothetical protein [Nocardioides sp. CFH 31398]|uniref:hypothetical protein n=1 Tax=Nocardioides sp. CFH 31398 TaxID=2919579 RepID=UPI001F05476E|nr:hypothetical protein [Nocardioides sp. CFH 31398]MCH1866455.1 hypothetical protein [Nocardioides sp. CFH 31398]